MADATPDPKTEYEAEAQGALDKLRTQIDELRVQADLAGAEARDRIQAGLETLRRGQAEAKVKLDEAQSAGADVWKSIAKQAEQLVDDLGDAFAKLADEVQDALGAAGKAADKGRTAFNKEWRKAREQREKLLGD